MLQTYKKRQVVSLAFRGITQFAYYDEFGCQDVIDVEDKLCDIPNKMFNYIRKNKIGNSFIISAALMKVLHDNGAFGSMIFVPDENDLKAAILYAENGKFFVADPSYDIKFFTDNNIKPEVRSNFYSNEMSKKFFDNSRISLQDYVNKYGNVYYVANFYQDKLRKLGDVIDGVLEENNVIATYHETEESYHDKVMKKIYG